MSIFQIVTVWLKTTQNVSISKISQTLEKFCEKPKKFEYFINRNISHEFDVRISNQNFKSSPYNNKNMETLFEQALKSGSIVLYKNDVFPSNMSANYVVIATFPSNEKQWKNEICNIFTELKVKSISKYKN